MHTIFKQMKTKRIELSDGYHLEPDAANGLTLVLEEIGEKENKKTGKKEPYLKKQKYYQPTLSQTFHRYLVLTTNEAESIEETVEILERVEGKIDSMKDYF